MERKMKDGKWLLATVVVAVILLAGQRFLVGEYTRTMRRQQSESSPETQPEQAEEDRSGKAAWQASAQKEPEEEAKGKKVAYLTFDDGPSELTEEYLDILERHQAKATFFLIGQQIQGDMKKVVRREIREGHEIGIHTYNHESGKIYASADAYYRDVCQVKKILKNKFQYDPALWRFPWGSANCYICHYKQDIIGRLQKENMDYADWNVSAEDSVGSPTPDSILANIRKDCFRVEEPVILMHDSNSNRATLETLEAVIEMLEQEGYCFATLSERKKSCHFGEY